MCYHANIYDLDANQMDKILMPGVNAKNASCKHTSYFFYWQQNMIVDWQQILPIFLGLQ